MYGRVTQVGAEPSDERVKGRGSRGLCVRAAFGFTNDIQTLKCDNFVCKASFFNSVYTSTFIVTRSIKLDPCWICFEIIYVFIKFCT
jgi:hypothetical protein